MEICRGKFDLEVELLECENKVYFKCYEVIEDGVLLCVLFGMKNGVYYVIGVEYDEIGKLLELVINCKD